MIQIISILTSLTLLILAAIIFVMNKRGSIIPGSCSPRLIASLLMTSSVILLDTIAGDVALPRLVLYLMLSLIQILIVSSSTGSLRVVSGSYRMILAVQCAAVLFSASSLAGYMSLPSDGFYAVSCGVCAVGYLLLYLLMQWQRVRDIRKVMKSGTVWANLEQTVEAVYCAGLLLVSLVLSLSVFMPSGLQIYLQLLAVLLALLSIVLSCARVISDSLFSIARNLERLILESLKVSQVEMVNNGKTDTYKELYDRLLEYFETERPYLKHDLTINDISRVVFSNRLYISRAISRYTGRNFRQFVNYYRVSYSLSCFRNNPDLRITEMSYMAGFNSVVSFNMAFRLFMNESPSEWCRKERYKILKKKK